MADSQKNNNIKITYTVAECGEFHSLGEYHEGIETLEEAAAVYRTIPPDRLNGIPSIGIKIHADGAGEKEDIQFDILSGSEIDRGVLYLLPDSCHARMLEIIKKLAGMFPDKEVMEL